MDPQPTWDWSSAQPASDDAAPSASERPEERTAGNASGSNNARPSASTEDAQRRRYGPRSCRICLDTEYPKWPTDVTTTLGISSKSTRPTYECDDPELGRLLSPCKCKGSQKYVHEGCLNSWRLANPTAARNYWQCPTCKFTYRMARLQWASVLGSNIARIGLTALILIISLFILGYIADPLFDLWFDPFGTLTDAVADVILDVEAIRPPAYQEPTTWYEHFAKGFASLGLVGLAKAMLAAPLQFFYYRGGGILGGGGGGRRGGAARGRDQINWILILLGAFTFLMAIWKFVKNMSTRLLKNVSERVLDVGEDDDDDDESRKDR